MTETPTLDIAELDRLEKAATPPGWRVEDGSTTIWSDNAYDPATNNVGCIVARTSNPPTWKVSRPTHDETIANSHLIAALRNAAPALIAAAKERDELRAANNDLAAEHSLMFKMSGELQTELASLRALLVRAGEAVQAIHVTLAPGNRTFDELMRDAMLADDAARVILALISEMPRQ